MRNAKTFEARRKRFLEKIGEAGVSKALIGSPLSIYYLTGVMLTPYERFMAVSADGETGEFTAVLPSLDQGKFTPLGIGEAIYNDGEDFGPLLKGVFRGGRAGVDMDYFSMTQGEAIRGALGEGINVSGVIHAMRMVKDESEIELLQGAVRRWERAMAAVIIKPGMTEKELLLALFAEMGSMPGVTVEGFVIQALAGAHTAFPHENSGDGALKQGNSVTIDFGVCYNNYWSDMCRNFFIGKPVEKLENIYKIVREASETAIAAIKPGMRAKDVDAAARKVIAKAGYGEQFIHRTGHGIGLEIHEPPYINGQNELVLVPGMAFTVEPGVYVPGLGGVRIEDNVVVTESGARNLSAYTKDFDSMIVG